MPAQFRESIVMAIDKLHPHPDNPNRGDINAISQSLQEFGQYRSVVATSDGTILAGHHVVEAAKRDGWTQIRVDILDVDEATARKIMLADNRIADLGLGPDLDLLLEALEKVDDFTGTGFDDEYLAMLQETNAGAPPLDELQDEANDAVAPEEFYRRLTLVLDPKTVTRWEQHRKNYGDDNEAFISLLDAREVQGIVGS